jgi:hypothetical protein
LQERIYNDHVRLLSPEPVGWLSHHQLYSDVGADIVMELITLIDPDVQPVLAKKGASRNFQ